LRGYFVDQDEEEKRGEGKEEKAFIAG